MYKLEYYTGNKLVESYIFPTRALCMWKKKQLVDTHVLGEFKISKV